MSAKQAEKSVERPLRIGLLHYSCPPVVGGVEEVVSQQASVFHRLGHSPSILAGMGDVYTKDFPVRLEPSLSSQNASIIKAQEACKKGQLRAVERPTNRIFRAE